MPRVAIASLRRVTRDGARTDQDLVAVEAPLAIEIVSDAGRHALGVFLRTPGDDEALGAGLLYAEGLIRRASDIRDSTLTLDADEASGTLRVTLAAGLIVDAAALARSGVATTACGLCGRLTMTSQAQRGATGPRAEIAPEQVFALPARLRGAQAVFEKTGGLHAAALVDRGGVIVDTAEDVGRHNAVDKVIGRALLSGTPDPPGHERVLVVSGRVAFELVQKAAMAGVDALVAIGAPTSLAIQAARDAGLTLIGFAKDGSYNNYA